MPKQNVPSPPALTFVTPEMASEWLESNTENRSIRQQQVNSLARDMEAGAWQITGDPVKFDDRGVLIDGQHRLWAIVQSDKTVPLFVIRNLPTSVRDVIDTNVARSAADALRFAGTSGDVKMLAAAARIAMTRAAGGMQQATDAPRIVKYTNTEVAQFIDKHPELVRLAPRAAASSRMIGYGSKALWLYMLAAFDAIDETAALEFETSLIEMTGFTPNDARATLLKWLRDQKAARMTSYYAMPRTMFATGRVWNAWRLGKSLSKIQIADGAVIPELI